MSELKVFKVVSAYIEYEDGTHDSGFDFEAYDKDEADKVIAEKDKEIARQNTEIKNAVIDLTLRDKKNDELAIALKHQKYKRCLTMAEWCNSEIEVESFACFKPRRTKQVWREEHKFWTKWRKIWFELAERFKEAK